MSRIKNCFETLRQRGRKALIPFLTAGDPTPASTVPLLHALVKAGADLIELGVPFSDPMADGPVIQRSSERALKQGVSLRQVLEMVAEFRKQDVQTPIVLMGYLNPVEIMGYQNFTQAARATGVDGVLTVDLPPEESGDWVALLRQAGMDPVFLFAPTTSAERAARICATASGFIYYVSLKGVTGANTLDVEAVAARIRGLRQYTSLPIGVGFGVKDAATAAALSKAADAVVVGSALVALMERHADDPATLTTAATAFIADLRRAVDQA